MGFVTEIQSRVRGTEKNVAPRYRIRAHANIISEIRYPVEEDDKGSMSPSHQIAPSEAASPDGEADC
jgi:hypothetical protein